MNPHQDVAQLVYNWISERLLFIAYYFLIFAGALFYNINKKNQEDKQLPLYKRFFTTLFSVSLMALIVYGIGEGLELKTFWMCVLSAFGGMGADKGSSWLMALWETSDDWSDFIGKLTRVLAAIQSGLSAFNGTLDELKKNKKPE